MALVVEMSPEAETMIRMKAAIRGLEVAEYVLFLIDRDGRQKQRVAKADDIHKSVEDQSAEIYQQ